MKAMDVKEENDRIVEVESHYNLMQLFNAINQERNSLTFSYHGNCFWKEDNQFMAIKDGMEIPLGEIVDFEEFKNLIQVKS